MMRKKRTEKCTSACLFYQPNRKKAKRAVFSLTYSPLPTFAVKAIFKNKIKIFTARDRSVSFEICYSKWTHVVEFEHDASYAPDVAGV